MKKILFPTDFSNTADKAFIYALHLADKLGASITTLHVYQKPDVSGSHMAINLQDLLKDYDLWEFKNYKDAIPPLVELAEQNGFGHIPVQHVLEEGTVESTILKVIERDTIDLVVMGTTGASGLKKLLLGSTTGEILENASCPVLSVPEKSAFDGAISKIAFTTNYKKEDKMGLLFVDELAKAFKADIYCVNVDLAHTESIVHRMEPLKNEFSDKTNIHFQVLEGTNVKVTLTKFMEEEGIDILAMVSHKRTFLQELFEFSRTKEMSYHSHIPVLSIQEHNLEKLG